MKLTIENQSSGLVVVRQGLTAKEVLQGQKFIELLPFSSLSKQNNVEINRKTTLIVSKTCSCDKRGANQTVAKFNTECKFDKGEKSC